MQALSDAIAAIKAGRNSEARDILTGILANDPQNISALLWATQTAQTISERREYLGRVLVIDPNNAPARCEATPRRIYALQSDQFMFVEQPNP